ncbi:MAG: glycosyltransferase family 4 protein [Chloroflexi bacterium]|nr:MAG: glycosyltransferase family 4 protein [Chloroflexota bacterium]
MTRPASADPCLQAVERPPLPGPQSVRVVEVLATGTNGGAQEHLYTLLTRIDRSRYDVSVVSLSPGSAVRKLQREGIAVAVIDDPDDAIAVGALAAHLAILRPDVIHNHMYRAELVGTRAAIALGIIGHRRPYVVSTVHSSRVRSAEDREQLRRLTPHMDQLIAVSQAMERKIVEEGRSGAPVKLIYNGVDIERYEHQEPCCTLRDEYGMEPGAQIVGVVARLEPEKGHPTLLEAWPQVLRKVPDAYLLVVGEGSKRSELEQQARDLRIAHRVVFTGRRDDVPAVTAALDVAVLPSYREAQGLTILEAMALSRPVVASNVGGIPEVIEDGVTGLLVPPHDAEALAAAIVRLLTDHAWADTIARAGHDLVHDRFCVELMVKEIEAIYDAGARAVRLSGVAAG